MNNLTPNEKLISQDQSPICDRFAEQDDLAFSYPGELFSEKNAKRTAGILQRAMNFLKNVTNLNPTNELGSRLIIRWRKDSNIEGKAVWGSDKDNNGNIIGHHVNLTWDYMFKPCEPFRICAHEFVHPFYRVSPLHEKKLECAKDDNWLGNEGWGEGFCDFMRGPITNSMLLPGNQGLEWWLRFIKKTKNNEDGTHQNPAGQFVVKYLKFCGCNENSISQLIYDNRQLKAFISYLFNEFACRPLKSEMTPTKKMIEVYGNDRL